MENFKVPDGRNYISYVDRTDGRYHRSHWILHDGSWIFAEFDTKEQLDAFAKTIGFEYEQIDEKPWFLGGIYRRYAMNKSISDGFHFWKLEDLPEGARPILALSNGSIVTCYYLSTENTIEFYRPNPNAKEVYNALPTFEHIAHQRRFGSY